MVEYEINEAVKDAHYSHPPFLICECHRYLNAFDLIFRRVASDTKNRHENPLQVFPIQTKQTNVRYQITLCKIQTLNSPIFLSERSCIVDMAELMVHSEQVERASK